MRVRLADPASAPHLLAFLRRRACVVEQVAANAFDVWPPPLLHEQNGSREMLLADTVEAAVCFSCGVPIELGLTRLGSTRCHDCRSEPERPQPIPGNGHYQAERARIELRAYLRAWRAETGGAAAAVTD